MNTNEPHLNNPPERNLDWAQSDALVHFMQAQHEAAEIGKTPPFLNIVEQEKTVSTTMLGSSEELVNLLVSGAQADDAIAFAIVRAGSILMAHKVQGMMQKKLLDDGLIDAEGNLTPKGAEMADAAAKAAQEAAVNAPKLEPEVKPASSH